MHSKPFEQQKRATILEKSDEAILTFLNEILPDEVKEITKLLPKIPGFVGRPAETHMKLSTLVKRLRGQSGSTDTERAWDHFRGLFVRWVISHKELNRILDGFSNDEDFFPDGSLKVPANSPKDLECFRILVEASASNGLAREVISTFYEFGYFVSDPRIEALLGQARTESEVELDDLAKDLPRRLSTTDKRLQDLDSRVTLVENALREIGEDLPNEFKEIRTKANEFDERLKGVDAQVEEDSKKLTGVQSETRAWKNELATVRKEVDAARVNLETLLRANSPGSKEFKTLRSDLQALKVELDEQKKEITQLTATLRGSLLEKVDKVASRLNELEGLALQIVEPVRLDRISRGERDKKKIQLKNLDDAVRVLSDAYSSAGLTGNSSITLARDVFAALLAGELVTFAGSLGSLLVNASASALSCGDLTKIVVPPGFTDPIGVIQIAAKNADQSGSVPVLVLEGANCSPFELYGVELRRFITEFARKTPDASVHFFSFATVIQSPAALPVAPCITELGPVFDSDALSWRTRDFQQTSVIGELPKAILAEIWKLGTEETVDVTFLDSLADSLRIPESAMWKTQLTRALGWLMKIGLPDELPSSHGSATFGWVIPHAVACGKHPQDIGEAIAEAKLRSEDQKDPRIGSSLEAELRRLSV